MLYFGLEHCVRKGDTLIVIANSLLLLATSLLFFKLVTTNHWTSGKKNLVAIIGCLLWKIAVEILYMSHLFPLVPVTMAAVVANAPLAIAMVFITIIVMWFTE